MTYRQHTVSFNAGPVFAAKAARIITASVGKFEDSASIEDAFRLARDYPGGQKIYQAYG